ncbi:MAG: signal transduction histidine kinase [Arenicella sp.]|jgi:signal transduction histidine kinase
METLFYIISFVLIIASFLIGLLLGLGKSLKPENSDFEVPNSKFQEVQFTPKMMNEIISKVKEMISQDNLFSRFFAHDLKNAIHNMDGTISTTDSLPKEDVNSLRASLDNIRDSLDKFLKINISDESNKGFPISQLPEYLELVFRGNFKEHNIYFATHYKIEPSLRMHLDFSSLLRAFNNLILNSITALENSPSKKILLSFSKEAENIIITLADTGAGIAQSDQEKIFEPLFTLTGSSGIGLTHVKSFLENMGGDIKYLGAHEEFSTVFEIKLPIL